MPHVSFPESLNNLSDVLTLYSARLMLAGERIEPHEGFLHLGNCEGVLAGGEAPIEFLESLADVQHLSVVERAIFIGLAKTDLLIWPFGLEAA